MTLGRLGLDMSPDDFAVHTALNAIMLAGLRIALGVDSFAPPETLYHFTDGDGLVGILKSQQLWAGLATSLNDRSELSYGMGAATALFEDPSVGLPRTFATRAAEALQPPPWQQEGEGLSAEARAMLAPIGGFLATQHFVTSFCESVDCASQWLNYGRSGTGYAIGIDPSDLDLLSLDLVGVRYDPAEQDEFLRAIIGSMYREYQRIIETVPAALRDPVTESAATQMGQIVYLAVPQIKHPAFKTEHEWRLIKTVHQSAYTRLSSDPSTGLNVRVVQGRIVPYFGVPLAAQAVREVVIGSDARVDAWDAGLNLLCRVTLGRIPTLRPSRVPVRR